jgi:AraC-like DNA-binding protein
MDKATKERALRLLAEKKSNAQITYSDIETETGYSRRQLMRLSKRLETESESEVLAHGNSGSRAHNAASDEELRVIRELKSPYPNVTIAHFRDIYIEDVIENPARAGDVERYGLVPRSASWFRRLFEREGWRSPAQRGPRRDGDGRQHPKRLPLPRAGMMAQVDGTPHDWFGGGRPWCMHLAVDDATTGVLAGWFMERECMRGYARMMREAVTRHGIPRSMYSDKDSVFRAVKDGSPTQFALMMRDLGIRMIFANSPQAKGRVERHNSTAQMRLPTDIVRFGIRDYDEPNAWFNEFYAPYLNMKFSYAPLDPTSDFVPLPGGLDLSEVFRTRETRLARGCSISYGGAIYMMADADGVVLEVPDDTKLDVHVDAITEEMYVERSGKRWPCVEVAKRERQGTFFGIQDRRELQRHLSEMDHSGGYREG